jgi:Trehalose utilisation
MNATTRLCFRFSVAVLMSLCLSSFAAEKKIVLIAGKPSHGPGDHEFRAGCLLLKKCLDSVPAITSVVYSNGWPHEDGAFENADAVLIYADGGEGHPAIRPDRMKLMDGLAKKGVGIGCAHYGVEVPKGDPGQAMHNWIGGHYEHLYSVNPMWSPEFKSFPDHPVTRGVKPFSVLDEWYFNMRWRPELHGDASTDGAARTYPNGLTPILVAKPSDDVRDGPYVYPKGPYQHIIEASGRNEVMMWVYERPEGGRGFGFTGGHRHVNWGNDNFRKVVLNALLWIAHTDVPAQGVECAITDAELSANLDLKGTNKPPPTPPANSPKTGP